MSRARTVQQVQSARATRDGLTEAQDDGRACVSCGAEGFAMVPTGARGSRGAQLFECERHRKGAADLAARCDECGVLTVGLLQLEELFVAIADASARGES